MHRLVNDMIRLPVKQSGPRLLQLDDVPAVHVVAAHQHQVVQTGAGQDQGTGTQGGRLLYGQPRMGRSSAGGHRLIPTVTVQ